MGQRRAWYCLRLRHGEAETLLTSAIPHLPNPPFTTSPSLLSHSLVLRSTKTSVNPFFEKGKWKKKKNLYLGQADQATKKGIISYSWFEIPSSHLKLSSFSAWTHLNRLCVCTEISEKYLSLFHRLHESL